MPLNKTDKERLAYNAQARQYRAINSEKVKLYQREYLKIYRESAVVRQKQKAYYLNNKQHIRIKSKQYYESNKDKAFKYNRKYYAANKHKILIKQKAYNEKKKEFINARSKNKRISDTLYCLKMNTRNMINKALSRQGYKKQSKTEIIIGCSFSEFKFYLESKFESWMNWMNRGLYNGTENYGWDIDHITPLKKATCKEDIIRLNHFTNLRPYCSYRNRVKEREL